MNKDFNVAGNQPVYCMFFPYKAEFKSRLEELQLSETQKIYNLALLANAFCFT